MGDGISSTGELLSNESFVRWVNGASDKEEALEWDLWCRQSEYNRRLSLKAQGKLIGLKPAGPNEMDFDAEWASLHTRIHRFQPNKVRNNRSVQSAVWWYRLAAVLLIAAVVGFVTQEAYFQKADETPVPSEIVWLQIETAYGEQKTITLSDGSSITLSANSSLTYPEGWIRGHSIEMQLDGEAYFSVVQRKSPTDPDFKVLTPDGTVQVMGTRFMVDTEDERTRVVLEEGKVKIARSVAGNTNEGNEIIELEPNQLAEFSRFEESVAIKQVNTQVYTSWIRRVLVLDNTSFSYLVNKIKKTYGVEVEVVDPGLYDRRLTGSVSFRSLDLLVQAISGVLEIDVRQFDNKVVFGSHELNLNINQNKDA